MSAIAASEGLDALAVRGALQQLVELAADVDAAALQRFQDQANLPLVGDRGVVNDGPRQRRHRNPVDLGCIDVGQHPAASNQNALGPWFALTANGHLDRAARRLAQVPERQRAAMAQYRNRWSASENRRHPTAFEGELAVPDGVHAPVDAMQPTRVEATLHLGPTDRERQQLPPSDDTVLLGGEQRQRSIDRSIQCGYTSYWVNRLIHAAQRPTTRVTRGSRAATTQRKTCDKSATESAADAPRRVRSRRRARRCRSRSTL